MKKIREKIEAINNKIPEEKREKIAKRLRIARTVKNVVCWVMIGILVVTVVLFLTTRINGGTPSFFGYTLHRVETGSMEPELHVGDVILNHDVSDISELKYGDIITFKGGRDFNNNTVTHRVINIMGTSEDGKNAELQTKGDANDVSDKAITMQSVESKMIGKVGVLKAFYEFFLSPWGLIIFIGLLLLVFFDEIINIVKIMSGYYDDDEDHESISEIIERIQREDREKAEKEKQKPDLKSEPDSNSEDTADNSDLDVEKETDSVIIDGEYE